MLIAASAPRTAELIARRACSSQAQRQKHVNSSSDPNIVYQIAATPAKADIYPSDDVETLPGHGSTRSGHSAPGSFRRVSHVLGCSML
jgi:hypothetical protein